MSDLTTHYQRPVGPWAQRIAGVVLAVAIVAVAWALWPIVVMAWRDGISPGEALATLIGVAAMLWFGLLAIRLMRASPASGDVLPPVALIGFGIVIAVAICAAVGVSFVEHVTVLNPLESLEGFVVAMVAISIGIRRRRGQSLVAEAKGK